MKVVCHSCHRTERWNIQGERVAVELEGGGRKPREHEVLAVFRAWADALHGKSGPVVGLCEACEQPMTADAPGLPWIEQTLELPKGPVQATADGFVGPDGPLTVSDARRLFETAYAEPLIDIDPGRAAFSTFVLGMMAVPVVLWVAAAFIVVLFLSQYTGESPYYVPQ